MNRELVQDYLEQSGLKQEQAHALSRIFAEMATKGDLAGLRADFVVLEEKSDALRSDLNASLAGLEARLTWRIIGTIVFLSTVMTLLNLYID
jgi:hypothetical protein